VQANAVFGIGKAGYWALAAIIMGQTANLPYLYGLHHSKNKHPHGN
jgi:hypothetical protein